MARKGRGPKGEGVLRLLAALGGAAALALSLSTCGIQTAITYFQPPSLIVIISNFSFTLTHNTSNNDPDLAGYDLYYRAYNSNSDATTALANLQTLASSTSSQTPYSVLNILTSTPSSTTELNSGFVPVFSAAGSTTHPYFPISTSELSQSLSFTVFTPASPVGVPIGGLSYSNWYYTNSSDTTTKVPILRYASSTQSQLSSFEEPFKNSDPDYYYDSGASGTSASTTYFVFFAVAYGTDFSSNNLTTVYSFPAVLGQVFTYTTTYS